MLFLIMRNLGKYLIHNLKKCFMKSSKATFNLQVSSKTKIVNNIYAGMIL